MFPYTLSTKLLHTSSFAIVSLKLLYSYTNPFPTNVPFFTPWKHKKTFGTLVRHMLHVSCFRFPVESSMKTIYGSSLKT